MSFEVIGDLNWLAVIVAAFAYFALGAVWYAPGLFGKAWQASIGWDPAAKPPQMGPAAYIAPFLAYMVAAIAIGMLAFSTRTDTYGEGAILGIVLSVGFVATLMFVTATFEPNKPKPMVWAAITGAYHSVGIIVASIILGAWT